MPATIDAARFDAVLFDMDGVLTATARVHGTCGKRMFDEFLARRTDDGAEDLRPFDIGRHLFDDVVDGHVAARLNLPAKPAPDTFRKAADLPGVTPERTVVIEDAIPGVRAGRRGGLGLVISVDHSGSPEVLRQVGAELVVPTLRALLG